MEFGDGKPDELPNKLKGDEDEVMCKVLKAILSTKKIEYQKSKLLGINCFYNVKQGRLFMMKDCFFFSFNQILFHYFSDVLDMECNRSAGKTIDITIMLRDKIEISFTMIEKENLPYIEEYF